MQIQIKEFTGPLDLLLQLIRREEMNIFDIDIHKITDQYLSFIETHPLPDLNSAGEFIQLAATLIYIKSKSLLPSEQTEQQNVDEEVEDLKETLVQNLLRVQKLQRLSQQLNQFPLMGRDVWTRNMIKPNSLSSKLNDPITQYDEATDQTNTTQITPSPRTDTLPIEQIKQEPILKLLKNYHRITQTKSWNNAQHTEPLPSLSDHIHNLSTNLSIGTSLKMSALISAKRNLSNTLLTFLSLLELGRLGFVSLFQQSTFSDIVIKVLKTFRRKDFHLVQKIEHPG